MRGSGMIVEFSIVPIGKGVSVSEDVAKCLEIVDKSGLPYRFNPMGTVIEGDFDQVMDVIKRCHMAVLEDAERVSTLIKIDDRKGATGLIDKKVESVERRLGKVLLK